VAGQTGLQVQRYRPAAGDDSLHLGISPRSPRAPRAAARSGSTTWSKRRGRCRRRAPGLVIERAEPFTLDAKRLIALADAGVPSGVIDLMVALSYPQAFAINPAARQGERRTLAANSSYREPVSVMLEQPLCSTLYFMIPCRDDCLAVATVSAWEWPVSGRLSDRDRVHGQPHPPAARPHGERTGLHCRKLWNGSGAAECRCVQRRVYVRLLLRLVLQLLVRLERRPNRAATTTLGLGTWHNRRVVERPRDILPRRAAGVPGSAGPERSLPAVDAALVSRYSTQPHEDRFMRGHGLLVARGERAVRDNNDGLASSQGKETIPGLRRSCTCHEFQWVGDRR